MNPSQVLVWALLLAAVPGPIGISGAATAGSHLGSLGSSIHPSISLDAVVHPMGEVCSTSSLCPATVRTAYNVTPLLALNSTDGVGQTVVIVDACGDPSIASDLVQFDKVNSLPNASLTVSFPQGPACKNSGWSLETALDVEWAHVMAPGAALDLLVSAKPSNADLFGAWNYSLAHHLGNQISDSWAGNGYCPSLANSILRTAAAQGVTILGSSGDGGDWGIGTTLVGLYPADCASILAVGGTTLSVNSTGAYVSESAWSGSGGGYVAKTTEKPYQSKVKVYDPHSVVAKPDVSAVADPLTGVWVYDEKDGGWFTVGGTSVACPLWAGFVADANDWRAANSYGPAGLLNPFLYLNVYGINGSSPLYAHDFHDVTTGSNGWPATIGWDAATGLGSFDAYNLARTIGNSPTA